MLNNSATMIRTPIAVLLFLGSTLSAFAQAGDIAAPPDSIPFRAEAERQFVEGMRFFTSAQYDSAAALFQNFLKEFPRSHRETGAYIMGAKALYHKARYRESIRLLKDLLDVYPQSAYVDDAHYTLGLNYYRLQRPEDAAVELLAAEESAGDSRLKTRAELLLNDIATNNLSVGHLQLLVPEAKSEPMKALLQVRLAERIYRSGDVRAAQDILQQVSLMNPAIPYVGEALRLYDQTRNSSEIRIGVVLPLMRKSTSAGARELGAEFLDGIQTAVDEHNASALTKITLDVRDSERDPAIAAQLVGELCRDDKVVAILGPAASNEVFASAGIANERGVPLITPTATSTGIAAIGPFIFQANPDHHLRGRASASYAFEILGARRYAVIAPDDAIGKQTTEAFVAEIKNRGGEVIAEELYPVGSTDIRSQLMSIRQNALASMEFVAIDFGGRIKQGDINKVLKLGIARRVIDSLIERAAVIDVTELLGADGKRLADSLRIPTTRTRLRIDSLAVPVPNIDVIYAPIASPEEIAVVSSQLKFVNFQAKVLGSGDWNDLTELDENRQYTDGVMFMADTYFDPHGKPYREFSARLARATKRKEPTINCILGYDVTRLLAGVIAGGATRRLEIAAALPRIRAFPGIHSVITIGPGRVNTFLSVLQYRNRVIRKIGEIDLSN